jgi:HEAT repeat protein
MKIIFVLTAVLMGVARPAPAQFEIADSRIAAVGAFPDDPGDSLYTAARAALAEKSYARAADLFHEITARYPSSTYAATAAYYEGFARYRLGDIDNLRLAYRTLRTASSKDAASLASQVCAALVKKGDSSCKQQLTDAAATPSGPCPNDDDDEGDIRISAMNALLQVDADEAMPILKKVLARRDACSATLRRKAVFLVSQKESAESADILLATAKSDPDQDVREQAVFWLSQVHDPRAVGMLDSLLLHSDDTEIREKALFALSQQHGSQTLRDFASRTSEPEELREKALFWLGQSGHSDDRDWLRAQFAREKDDDLKEKIIFDVSQHRDAETGKWLLGIASDSSQPDEIRKKAVFWGGQTGTISLQQLIALYNGARNDDELSESLIFAFSQTREPEAIDELMTIAKTDKNPDHRKRAVFWLGQSRDARVTKFLNDLINQ